MIGGLNVVAGIAVQMWAAALQTHPSVDVFDLAFAGTVSLYLGTILLAYANAKQLFAIYHRIDYVIALVGLASFGILVFAPGDLLVTLVYPRTVILGILIGSLLWMFLLGLMIRRFYEQRMGAGESPSGSSRERKPEWKRWVMSDDMKRVTNTGGLLLVLAGVAIQILAIMLQTHPSVDVSYLVTISTLPIYPGSILLVSANLDRLFSVYGRINYVISLGGLAGMIVLWLNWGYVTDLVYPRTIVVGILMIHLFWIFLLGPLVGRFHTAWLKERDESSTRSEQELVQIP
jgi:hypothetical protein